MSSEPVIGIDLGTTNSEVAICVDGKIEIIEENGQSMVPSVVGLDDKGELLVGHTANNQYLLHPENTVKSVKRKMGTEEKVTLGDQKFLPQEISAMILRHLKVMAERRLGRSVEKAVITVPAQFNDAQRQATRDAGAIAGLDVVRIVNEPTAACMAYEKDSGEAARNVLAFDLGGGTFDVSLVKVEEDVVEVITSHGDNQLGGDDFDAALADFLKEKLLKDQEIPSALAKITEYRLARAAETAKIHLSDFANAKIIEDNLTSVDGENLSLNLEITRHDFEEMLKPFLKKTILAVHQTLADAKLKVGEVDEIILVGGSTRSPAVLELLESEFNIRPRRDVHPDLAVAYGAGVMAARLMGEQDHRVLVDITPYTFGVSCMGMVDGELCPHFFAPIIKAGAPLPLTKEEVFSTMVDGQEQVDVRIFQGENQDARKNILIGHFMIEDLTEMPAGSPIVMNMRLDLDGILHCAAIEQDTGKSKRITIEDAMAKLTKEKIKESQKRVKELSRNEFDEEFEGEEDAIDVTGEPLDEINQDDVSNNFSEALLNELKARLSKVDEKMDVLDREDAAKLVEGLETAIKNRQKDDFEQSVAEIEDMLFYLENE